MRMLRVAWVLCCVAAALCVRQSGCKRTGDDEGTAGAGLNVLLISIDTLRADHLACYGHAVVKTPNIDSMAAQGTQFLQCSAPIPLTLPSHSSMLTATYPFVHGARDNGAFRLHEDNETLAEVLQRTGYATAAEVAAYVLNREFGLQQGFETYHDVTWAGKSGAGVDAHGDSAGERKADSIASNAIASLQANAGKRFFHFVHFFDPHFTYAPPARFASQYADPYLGEIAYVDEQIGRILAELDRLNLAHRTIVVLTADHGEGRFEHGENTHGTFLFDTTLAAPLLFRCPGKIPAGRRVDAQVRIIDIAPTILAFLGMDELPDAQGVSLLPLITGRNADLELAAYSETLLPLYNFGYSPLRSLRVGGWKYIHAPTPRLYDVRRDPGEKTNLADQHLDRVADMRDRILQLLTDAPEVVGSGTAQRAVSEEDLKRLADLGYIQTGGQAVSDKSELELFEPSGPDPHDHTDSIQQTTAAMLSMSTERFEEAEGRLRKILADHPSGAEGFYWVYKSLGFVLARRGAHEEAITYHSKALSLRPDDGITMTHLAVSLASLGKTTDAIATFESALKIPPTFAHTHENFGVALTQVGRMEDAEVQFRRALELEPKSVNARTKLARVYVGAGRFSEASAELERGLALTPGIASLATLLESVTEQGRLVGEAKLPHESDLVREPNQSDPHIALAEICARANQVGRAEEHLRRALEIHPGSTRAWEALAFVLLRRGDVSGAAKAFESGLVAEPTNVALANDLAWLLATTAEDSVRDGARALQFARGARERFGGEDANVVATVAAALAELGRFDEAISVLDEALGMAERSRDANVVRQLTERRALYGERRPSRMKP